MIDLFCYQGDSSSEYIEDLPIIEQIMYNAQMDVGVAWKPYPKRYGIKGKYGSEGEDIYYTAYWALQGNVEDVELLASKWGYKFGTFERPIKIEESVK